MFLRVDGVIVSIRDTRVFHRFGDSVLHLEISSRDASLSPPPAHAFAGYARQIYDDMAESFESRLVDTLGYRGPWQLHELVAAVIASSAGAGGAGAGAESCGDVEGEGGGAKGRGGGGQEGETRLCQKKFG